MLKIRIKDFDFLGGVAAVYLKNQNDLKNTLDDFIVSKDFLSPLYMIVTELILGISLCLGIFLSTSLLSFQFLYHLT